VQLTNARGVSLSSSVDAIDLLTEDEMIDALKQGRVQLAQVTAGLVPVATDTADAKAFAVRGDRASGKAQSYRLNLIVRTDSVYRKPLDLKGKTIAHSTPGSNSGNLAPRAYFPGLGLRPDADYTVVYSKGHERSITGVLHGFYDGAAVASDQLARMARKGEVRMGSFRVLWESPPFPVEAWMLSRAVAPAVQDKVMRCVGDYRIPPTVSALLDSADRYVLIDAEREFAPIRFVLDKNKPRSKP
jgi:phosphonate transport system substrate-binding protein